MSNWIKEMEGVALKVLKAGERAIQVGEPVLPQDVTETLNPSLKPILFPHLSVTHTTYQPCVSCNIILKLMCS